MRDINRTFELTGVGGGKRVFYYDADTINNVLYLQDKNTAAIRKNNRSKGGDLVRNKGINTNRQNWIPATALASIGEEYSRIHPLALSTRRKRGMEEETKNDPERPKMVLKYHTVDGSRVVLEGVDEQKNSIYVVLDRINKRYALTDSQLQAGEYGN